MPDEPVAEGRVVGDLRGPLRGQALQIAPIAPTGADLGHGLAPILRGRGPGIVGRARAPDSWVEQDETRATIRIRRGEEHGQAGARAAAPEDRSLRSGVVHDGPDVVHHRLERWDLADAIGEARPPLVEHEHATDGREAFHVSDEQGLFPGGQQVPGDAPDEDDIDRSGAHDLIGDRDVAAARVRHVRWLHGPSVHHHRARRHTDLARPEGTQRAVQTFRVAGVEELVRVLRAA